MPETLHALIAARLDGLSADERRLLQDAAVLGKTFTQRRAGRARGLRRRDSSRCSPSLVRKEVLGVQADPRSPEHGQYGFLQDLVRHVAYETLSKRERRARHLAAAAHLSAAFADDEDEVVEVIASHYLAAYEAAPGRRGRGRDQAARRGPCSCAPGERAASLAAAAEARRYFEQAAELTEEPLGAGGAPRPRGRDGDRDRRSRRGRAAVRGVDRAVRGRGRHARRRPGLGQLGQLDSASRGIATRRWRGWSAPSPSSRATSPTRISRSSPHALAVPTGTAAISSGRPSGRSWRWTSPRRMRIRRRSRSRCARRGPSPSAADTRRSPALSSACARDRARARPRWTRRPRPTSSSPTGASGATSTAMRSGTSTRRSRSPARSGAARRSGRCSPSGPTRCTCSGAGTRRSGCSTSSPRSRRSPAVSC